MRHLKHPGFDLIPHQWLHLTTQGLGHVADFTTEQIQTVIEAAQTRLAAIPPVTVQFHRLVIRPEAIVLPAVPPSEADRVRTAVREAIAETLGPDVVPERPDGFQPHITVAYSCSTQSAGAIASAVESIATRPVEVQIKAASLIELHRDSQMYEWRTVADASIGRPEVGQAGSNSVHDPSTDEDGGGVNYRNRAAENSGRQPRLDTKKYVRERI